MMSWHRSLVVCLCILKLSTSQEASPDCPDPWLSRTSYCYLFSTDDLSWSDANIACQQSDAMLLKVDDEGEHNWIVNWFLINDNEPEQRHRWFTGGHAVEGSSQTAPEFRWSDDSPLALDRWRDNNAPSDENGNIITYVYHDTGSDDLNPTFVWVKRSSQELNRFICEIAKSRAGRITSKDRDFVFGLDSAHPDRIYRGPYFDVEPTSVKFAVSVDAAPCLTCDYVTTFECIASGYPHPLYQWFENTPNRTDVGVVAESRNFITVTNGRLTIHNPNKEKARNSYYCTAENEFGIIKSTTANVEIISLAEFTKGSQTLNADAYKWFVIPCKNPSAEDNNIQLQYNWFTGGQPSEHVDSNYNSHLFPSYTGQLYFSSVFVSDANTYQCSVRLTGVDSSESRTSDPYVLAVNEIPKQLQPPAILDKFPVVIPSNPKRGDTVYLECFARYTGSTGDAAIYAWERVDGRPLGDDYTMDEMNRRITIPNAGYDDEGVYKCTASAANQGSDSRTVILQFVSVPFFTQGALQNEHRDEGETFTWICLANGTPLPLYSWLKNGRTFDENHPDTAGGRITFSGDKRIVTFRGLDGIKDPAMYQCAASNSEGISYSSAQLRVLAFPPTFSKHPLLGSILTTDGGNATIPCEPEAAPRATLSWLKNAKPVPSGRPLTNGFLYIERVNIGDSGTYTCRAENSLGTAEENITLVVLEKTRIDLQDGPVNTDVEVGDRVNLNCRAKYDRRLDILYQWEHNDRVIHFDDWKMAQIYQRGVGVDRGDLIIPKITYEERGRYRCRAITKSDEDSIPADVNVYGPPGEPAGLEATNPSTDSMLLTWRKGGTNGSPISGYVIEQFNKDTQLWIMSINGNVTESVEEYTVEGLFAATSYKFRISAINEYGIGDTSLPSAWESTFADVPTSYPRRLRGGGGKEGTLVILWDALPKEEWNGAGLHYEVVYTDNTARPSDDRDSWQDCEIPSRSSGPLTEQCVKLVGNNNFYKLYTVSVRAVNEEGQGPWSPNVNVRSAVRRPTRAVSGISVQAFNSSALIAYWNPIPDDKDITGGELTGFHLQYWKAGDSSNISAGQTVFKTRFGRRNTVEGNVTEGMVIGLEANTDYQVTVQIFNSGGDSTIGEIITQTTWMKAPQRMPEYVTINKTADNVVGVHFRGVVTQPDEEPLDGYKVRIWREGQNIRTAKDYDCGRRTWINIEDNFEREELYNLRVFGYSRGGVGKMSSPLLQFAIGCKRLQTNPDATWVYLCDGCSHQLSYAVIVLTLFIQLLRNYL